VNVVTEPEHEGAAVLVRALEPLAGIELMRERRGGCTDRDLTSGPARLCEALGIDRALNGEHFFQSELIRLEPYRKFTHNLIGRSTRVGITKARELEWRLFVQGNPFVSRGKPAIP
jgi:DNA-3-methyladenine glycosylase